VTQPAIWYFDIISPFAHLALTKLDDIRAYRPVVLKPIVFGAVLKAWGQLGPAEIAPKRDWTYRQVLWLAQRQGLELQLPATHPFNPLALLRLAVACEAHGLPNRYVCETIFRHVWRGGADAADATRLQALSRQLAPGRDPASAAVKADLQAHTQHAIEHEGFGVPTLQVDDRLVRGLAAVPMPRGYRAGPPWVAPGDRSVPFS